MNPLVNDFFTKLKNWQEEMSYLRKIVLDSELNEELKWRQPCYTFNGSNVIIIGGFKEFCTLSFFKGALLKDSYNILVKAGEDTQSARIVKFTNLSQIIEKEVILKEYICEAIEVEKSGLKVEFKKIEERSIPDELQIKFNENIEFEKAFRALTPGRQRAYLLYFTAPKQSITKTTRIEKYIKQILLGRGMHD